MKKTIGSIILSSVVCLAFSQIKPEVVEVEKSYEPQVKEALKIQRSPAPEPPERKLPVRYAPIEVPVQTRFQARPIQADTLDAFPQEKSFSNYLKAGYGNNNTFLGEGFIGRRLKPGHELGLSFKHWSTDGNIRSSRLNDKQWQAKAALFYIVNTEEGEAKITGGYERQSVNFYGLSQRWQKTALEINPKQTFNNVYAKIDWSSYRKSYLDRVGFTARRLWDRYENRETYLRLEGRLSKHPLIEQKIRDAWSLKADMDLDLAYQNTGFKEKDKDQLFPTRFGYFTAGASPLLKLSDGSSYLKLGLGAAYNMNIQRGSSRFYFYPLVELFIKTRETVGLFAGVRGGLQNHTYYELIQENPYLQPNQELKPTNTPLDVYGGLRGKVGPKLAYKIEAAYAQKEDDLFFINAPLKPSKNYGYENSFLAQYLNNNVFSLSTKLDYTPVRELELNAQWSFKNYDMKSPVEAWNRPNFTGSLSATYKMLNDKLSLGTDLFYVGRRHDVTYRDDQMAPVEIGGKTPLKAYVDVNLKGGYKISQRWSGFLRLNNLFNNAYYRYKNYRVQGFQILGGLTYKFH